MNESEIKPCKLCGAPAGVEYHIHANDNRYGITKNGDKTGYTVGCSACSARTYEFNDEKYAINNWNRSFAYNGPTQDQSADMQVRLLQNILDQLEKLNDTVSQWYYYGKK